MKKLLILIGLAATLVSCGVKDPTGNEEADASIAANYLYNGDQESYSEFIKKCGKGRYNYDRDVAWKADVYYQNMLRGNK